MPDQNKPSPSAASPFEIVTPGKSKKAGNRGIIVAIVIVVFLILSVVAGVVLVRQQQNIQEKAASKNPTPQFCPAAQACPFAKDPTLLRVCTPADTDQTPDDHPCSQAAGNVGKIFACGASQYCCPSSGASWTTDLTVCNSLVSPSPSPTVAPTPSQTPAPNTCNGTCTSDSSCAAGLICSGNFCRNPLCTSAADCICGVATAAPTVVPSAQTTPLPIPVTGVDWPTMAGIGVGAAAIIISILVAL